MPARPFPSPVDEGEPAPRPLVVTSDEQVLDDLLRLAAAVGVDVDLAPDLALARPRWGSAPLVLLGDDCADEVGCAGLPRRDGVVLVGLDLDDADVWQRGVAVGAEHVVFLPDAETWLVERLADALEGTSPATVLAVVGGRGGAGATTLASALAMTSVGRGLRTLLVDADPLGGGIDLVLGGEDVEGLRWPDLAATTGRVSGSALRGALPNVDALEILSWDRGDRLDVPREAARAVVDAASRTTDLVVVDLPRRPDEAAQEVLARATCTLLLVPAEVRAAAAASRVAHLVGRYAVDLRLVVRGPAPSGLSAASIADLVGLPLLGEMKAEPGLADALERGEPPARRGRGPLARLCGRVLDEVMHPAAERWRVA